MELEKAHDKKVIALYYALSLTFKCVASFLERLQKVSVASRRVDD
jgi:hypothetical protein